MSREPHPSRRRVPAAVPSRGPARRDTAAHLANRQRAASRTRTFRRRRALVLLATLAVVAAIVAACNAVTSAGSKPHKTTTTTSAASTTRGSTQPQTTTTTLPAAFEVGIHAFHWERRGAGVTHVGPTGAALPGRVLTTEIRYPTLAGAAGEETSNAAPSKAGGPYPVIIFAHGFETEPLDYAALLDSWVRAGFVVVSPVFPDESQEAVTDAGGMSNPSIADTLEDDVYNEPGDIVYVVKQLQSIASDPWGSHLADVMNLSDVGLAGQSDGANVVAALSYASGLHTLYAQLPSAPKAVAVLSGVMWSTESTGEYGASSGSPPLLQVQSDADGCVSPTLASYLFAKVQSGLASKWWVTLLGAGHLGPYEGVAPWAAVVEAATTKFFELELNWRASSSSAAAVEAAAAVSGVAEITSSVGESTVPQVQLIPGC
ncbi:MAG: hypothetical protein ACLQNG_07875 [Acidimicrobiales bacterium]